LNLSSNLNNQPVPLYLTGNSAKLYLSMIYEQLEMGYNSEYDSSDISAIKSHLSRLEDKIEVFVIKSE